MKIRNIIDKVGRICSVDELKESILANIDSKEQDRLLKAEKLIYRQEKGKKVSKKTYKKVNGGFVLASILSER